MIITTTSTRHLNLKSAPITVKHFKDGELYVKVPKLKSVTVVASFPSAESVLELAFILDALRRQHTKVHLIITYFGYARQTKPKFGESLSAEVICRLLKADKIAVIDAHSDDLRKFLKFENIIPIKAFLPFVPKDVVLVAPDEGAIKHAKQWQKFLRVPVVCLKKRRIEGRVMIVGMKGNVKGKNVLIVDDMISTGDTIIEAAKLLRKSGANDIYVAATHGIFAGDALKNLSKSPVRKIFVTDSLPQRKHRLVKVVSIKSLLTRI